MNEDVKQDSVSTEPEVAPVEATQTEPGSKTDSALLLKSLQEERELRRKEQEDKKRLEAELEALRSADITASPDLSDEAKVLKNEIDSLRDSIALKETLEKFPALKDKSAEFEQYRRDYPNIGLEKVAKLFLVENNIIEEIKPRKGLEKQVGGVKTPPQTGMTAAEIKELRDTNFRKYSQLVRDGKIKL